MSKSLFTLLLVFYLSVFGLIPIWFTWLMSQFASIYTSQYLGV